MVLSHEAAAETAATATFSSSSSSSCPPSLHPPVATKGNTNANHPVLIDLVGGASLIDTSTAPIAGAVGAATTEALGGNNPNSNSNDDDNDEEVAGEVEDNSSWLRFVSMMLCFSPKWVCLSVCLSSTFRRLFDHRPTNQPTNQSKCTSTNK